MRRRLANFRCLSLYFTVTFLVPFIFLMITYGRIAIKLWFRRPPEDTTTTKDRLQVSSRLKVIKMVAIVILAFFLCWLPLQTLVMVVTLKPEILMINNGGVTIVKLYFCLHLLGMSHSFLNPFIYTFLKDNFKKDVKDAFRPCLLPKHRRADSYVSTARFRSSYSTSQGRKSSMLGQCQYPDLKSLGPILQQSKSTSDDSNDHFDDENMFEVILPVVDTSCDRADLN
ncbi:G-protein coupled receptor 83-like [Ptychodera flava]|uniref:G-protein coupled receptor 83-like n=1 Tax=Ptychodera flava TaxID=63121 RepID=UPI00396A8D05